MDGLGPGSFRYDGKSKRASWRPRTHACVLNWTVCFTPSVKHPLHRQTSPAKLRWCGNHTPSGPQVKRFFDGEQPFYFCAHGWYKIASQIVYILLVSNNLPAGLKEQLQSELYESWICARRSRGHNPKVLIIGGTADRVRRGELSSVKQVKEFCPEFDTEPLAARESGSFE